MLTLFQISTGSNWSIIAYISWFGCDAYARSPYNIDDSNQNNERVIETMFGDFQGFRCGASQPLHTYVFFFYGAYIILTTWIIMSLFIGVIADVSSK